MKLPYHENSGLKLVFQNKWFLPKLHGRIVNYECVLYICTWTVWWVTWEPNKECWWRGKKVWAMRHDLSLRRIHTSLEESLAHSRLGRDTDSDTFLQSSVGTSTTPGPARRRETATNFLGTNVSVQSGAISTISSLLISKYEAWMAGSVCATGGWPGPRDATNKTDWLLC